MVVLIAVFRGLVGMVYTVVYTVTHVRRQDTLSAVVTWYLTLPAGYNITNEFVRVVGAVREVITLLFDRYARAVKALELTITAVFKC